MSWSLRLDIRKLWRRGLLDKMDSSVEQVFVILNLCIVDLREILCWFIREPGAMVIS